MYIHARAKPTRILACWEQSSTNALLSFGLMGRKSFSGSTLHMIADNTVQQIVKI
jgi:hypothetical protein